MIYRALSIILISAISFVCKAETASTELISLLAPPKSQFNPSLGEVSTIRFKLEESSQVVLFIYSPDQHLLRTFGGDTFLQPGEHTFEWDGKDSNSQIVPNEAYNLVIHATTSEGKTQALDYRATGGKPVPEFTIDGPNNIGFSYYLRHPARVLIRIGIEGGGPLFQTLGDWSPRPMGRGVIAWDGYDASGAVNVREVGNNKVIAKAESLPDHSIITFGNAKQNYSEYIRAGRDLWKQDSLKDTSSGSQRASRRERLPHFLDISPEIKLETVTSNGKTIDGVPIIHGATQIRVTAASDDFPDLQASSYEISFYVDQQFFSEVERGYVPLNWRWNPLGVEQGRHILTTNLIGFDGRIGTASMEVQLHNENRE